MMTSLQLATPPPLVMQPADAMFASVLLGIDFGSASLAAARWATSYVSLRAHAILSHVMPFADDAPDGDDFESMHTESLRQMMPALTGGLGGFAATLDIESSRSILRIGRPSRWLSAVANEAEVPLMVLGRRTDANRIRVGEPNVIERAARNTNASVLVVPEGTVDGPSHVVAAVDESPFAPLVLRAARRLARTHEIPLTVLHVLSPAVGAYERVLRSVPQLVGGGRKLKALERAAVPATLPPRTARWLVQLGEAHNVLGRDRTEVAMVDAAREITATATASDAPLIVVGMRGADGAPVGSIGSVTRELLTRAPVPVLAVAAT